MSSASFIVPLRSPLRPCHREIARCTGRRERGPRVVSLSGYRADGRVYAVVCCALPLRRRRRSALRHIGLRAAGVNATIASPRRETLQALWDWLRRGGAEVLDDLELKPSADGAGIGVFSTRSFHQGDEVITLPRELCLEHDEKHAVIAGLSDPIVKLAAALLQECSEGGKSRFWPYLEDLRAQDSSSLPLMWPKDFRPEVLFAGSPRMCRRLRLAFMQGAYRAHQLLRAGITQSEMDARWALAIVESRSFTVREEPDPKLALCPLLDLLNHYMPHLGKSWACHVEQVDESFRMLAERSIEPSDELQHVYGAFSSARLLSTYGFADVPSENVNPWERCDLLVPAKELRSGDEAARAAKARALKERGLWRGERHNRALRLTLPKDAEVGGRMLPVARLASLSEADDVERLKGDIFYSSDGAVTNESPPKPKDLGVEIEEAARRLVCRWIGAAVEKIDNELVRLDRLMCADPSMPSSLLEQAQYLLKAEREVLVLELRASEGFLDDMDAAKAKVAAAVSAGRDMKVAQEAAYDALYYSLWDSDDGWMGAG